MKLTSFSIFPALVLTALFLGCGTKIEREVQENSDLVVNIAPVEVKTAGPSPSAVDVPELVNKSASYFDDQFGKPVKITLIENVPALMPGEYREYQIEGHPKGLSVRFHRDKAKRFNLLLGKPGESAEKSLAKIFRIDVKEMNRVKTDPLSESWTGRSGVVSFKTAYAKRDKPGGKFVMLHAEIAN